MPRNAAGTYSLPAGNPVVTGTTISSVWANTTLSDIGSALTDSLSRSGDGGMTAPLELDSGTIGAPGLTWSVETTSGLYRAAAGDFRYSISAADALQITVDALKIKDGTVALPGLSFISDPDTGFYRIGANNFAVALTGIRKVTFDNNSLDCTFDNNGQTQVSCLNANVGATALGRMIAGVTGQGVWSIAGTSNAYGEYIPGSGVTGRQVVMNTGLVTPIMFATNDVYRLFIDGNGASVIVRPPLFGQNGTVGAPGLTFENDSDSGLYRNAANRVGMAAAGALSGWWDTQGIGVIDGAIGGPGFYFVNDTDTGMYRAGNGNIRISCNATNLFDLDVVNQYIRTLTYPHHFVDGTINLPGVTFASDPDTGLYRGASGTIRFATNASSPVAIDPTGLYIMDGSAGAPSLKFDNDTNTGFYRDTADQIAIALGGVTAGQIVQGTFTGTLTGCTTAPTQTFNYQRIGKYVKIWLTASLTATSNANTMTVTGVPAIIRPTNVKTSFCFVEDNAITNFFGSMSTDSGGTLTFAIGRTDTTANYVRLGQTSFTNSGVKGLQSDWSVSYVID